MGTENEPELDERRIERRRARSVQTYKIFLKHLCAAGKMSEDFAEQAAIAVLCSLEPLLEGDSARRLEAQLPLQLTNLLAKGERPSGAESAGWGREKFLEHVGRGLGMQPDEVEPVVRAVLGTVRHHISDGAAEEVMSQLPAEIAELWQWPT